MKFYKKNIQLFAVIFPVLLVAIWIGSYSFVRQTARELTFPIVGFDPRDLLSGHYLQYQIDYKLPLQCKRDAQNWCLCIEEGKQFAYASAEGRCEELSCNTYLRGRCEGVRFVAGIERYYFPEKYKTQLALVPPESSITVSLRKSGDAVVKSMQVKEMPLLQWLELQGRE